MAHFDLIFWNNSTKIAYLFPKKVDLGNDAYYNFRYLDFSDMPSGEYTYAIVRNEREDVEYVESEIPANTLIKTEDGEVHLRDLAYETGIMKLKGENAETQPSYRDKKVEFHYYKRK